MAANRVTLYPVQANLRNILEESYDVIGILAAEKKLDVSYTFDCDVPLEVIVDKKRLRQILVNLLSNAVKFTNEGSVLTTVSSQSDENTGKHTICFRIKDTGIGISKEDQERVFRSFEQKSDKFGGTGLGLPISCKLAELMEGKITLFSEGINKGSCFELRVSVEESQNDQLLLNKVENTLKGKCALLVDDNHVNRMVLANLIMNWNMHPLVASSVDEALMYVNSNSKIDIAFLDIRLPNMSGFELATLINKKRPQLPMVAISSIGENYPSSNSNTPFCAYMLKPIKQKKLFNICVSIFTTNTIQSSYEQHTRQPQQFLFKILLVEDSAPNREVAKAVFQEIKYENVVICNNGLEAFEIIKKNKTDFDIIFMDIRMPLLDGYEATLKIKEFYKTTSETRICPYIVAMTACVLQEDREKAKKVGMDAFLPKPVTISDVKNILDVAKNF
jgi:CheY-like chemotaxis protein